MSAVNDYAEFLRGTSAAVAAMMRKTTMTECEKVARCIYEANPDKRKFLSLSHAQAHVLTVMVGESPTVVERVTRALYCLTNPGEAEPYYPANSGNW